MNKIKNYSIPVLILFHLVGIVGLTIDEFQPLFLQLTPLNLVLTTVLLVLGIEHKTSTFWKTCLLIALLGFCIEVAGVHTKVLFGAYQYGPILGVQLFNVPLTIGLNWLVLCLSAVGVVHYFIQHKMLTILISALLMVMLDVLIEPVAIQLNFWQWTEGSIPFQNYLMWLVAAIGLNAIVVFQHLKIPFYLSAVVFGIQVVFFSVLNYLL